MTALSQALRLRAAGTLILLMAAAAAGAQAPSTAPAATAAPAVAPAFTGMPPILDAKNVYSAAGAGMLSAAVKDDLVRVYVPERRSNDVVVIDPATRKIVDRYSSGGPNPQHIVPSWDLRSLWVTNNAEHRKDGTLMAIDPRTGKPAKPIAVDDPYNMYFMPDGSEAIVVAEAHERLDFRDPRTMALHHSLAVPGCKGINHADFALDGSYAIFTCEFTAALAKIDLVHRRFLGLLALDKRQGAGMPQDVRVSPDGSVFYVADMMADGVFLIDGAQFKAIGKIPTGVGAHGLYPSRDGHLLYVANRGSNKVFGPPHGKGSVTVIDFAARKVVADWPIPGGGSPDMGNVSADGRELWLSGRFDDEVYVFDTQSGKVDRIPVGLEPHGLTVWPQPGRYSLGHTGNMR